MQASSPGRRPIRARQVKLFLFPVLLLCGMALALMLSAIEQVKGDEIAGHLFFGLFDICLFLVGAYFFALLAAARRRLEPVQRSAPAMQGFLFSTLGMMCLGLTFASQHLLTLWLGDSWVPLTVSGVFCMSGMVLLIASLKRLYSSYARQ